MSFIDYNFFPILFFLGWNILTTKQFRPNIDNTSNLNRWPKLSVFELTNSMGQKTLQTDLIGQASPDVSLQTKRWGGTKKKDDILQFVPQFRSLSANEKSINVSSINSSEAMGWNPTAYNKKTSVFSIKKNTDAFYPDKKLTGKAYPCLLNKQGWPCSLKKRFFREHWADEGFNLMLLHETKKHYFTNQNLINCNWKENFKSNFFDFTYRAVGSQTVNAPKHVGSINYLEVPKRRFVLSSFSPYNYKKIKSLSITIESSFKLASPSKNRPMKTDTSVLLSSASPLSGSQAAPKESIKWNPNILKIIKQTQGCIENGIFFEGLGYGKNNISFWKKTIGHQTGLKVFKKQLLYSWFSNKQLYPQTTFFTVKVDTKKPNTINFIQKRRSKIRLLLRIPIQKIYSLNRFQIALSFSKILQPDARVFSSKLIRKSPNTNAPKIYDSFMSNSGKNEFEPQTKISERVVDSNVFAKSVGDSLIAEPIMSSINKRKPEGNQQTKPDRLTNPEVQERGRVFRTENTDTETIPNQTSNVEFQPMAFVSTERQAPPANYKKRKSDWWVKTQFFQHVGCSMKHKISDGFSDLPKEDLKTMPFTKKDDLSINYKKSVLLNSFSEGPQKDFLLGGHPFSENSGYASRFSEELTAPSTLCKEFFIQDAARWEKLPSGCSAIGWNPNLISYGGSWYYENLAFPYSVFNTPPITSLSSPLQTTSEYNSKSYYNSPLSTKLQTRFESDIGIYSLAHKLSSIGFRNSNDSIDILPFKYNDSYRYNFQNMNLSNYRLESFLGLSDFRNKTRDASMLDQRSNTNIEQDLITGSGSQKQTRDASLFEHPYLDTKYGRVPRFEESKRGMLKNLSSGKETYRSNVIPFLSFKNPTFSKMGAPLFQPPGLNLLSFLDNSFFQIISNYMGHLNVNPFFSLSGQEKSLNNVPIINENSKSKTFNSIYHKLPINGIHTNPYPWITQNALDRWNVSGSACRFTPNEAMGGNPNHLFSPTLSEKPVSKEAQPSQFESLQTGVRVSGLNNQTRDASVFSVWPSNRDSRDYQKENTKAELSNPLLVKSVNSTKLEPLQTNIRLTQAFENSNLQVHFPPKSSYIQKPLIFFSSFRHLPYFFISSIPSTKNKMLPQTNLSLFPLFKENNGDFRDLKKNFSTSSNSLFSHMTLFDNRVLGSAYRFTPSEAVGWNSKQNKNEQVMKTLKAPVLEENLQHGRGGNKDISNTGLTLQNKSFSLKPLSIFMKKELGYETSLFSKKTKTQSPVNEEKFLASGSARRLKKELAAPSEAIGWNSNSKGFETNKASVFGVKLNTNALSPDRRSIDKTNLASIQKNKWKIFPPLFQPLTFRFIDLNLPRTWSSELSTSLLKNLPQKPYPSRFFDYPQATTLENTDTISKPFDILSQTKKWNIAQKKFFHFPIPFRFSDFFHSSAQIPSMHSSINDFNFNSSAFPLTDFQNTNEHKQPLNDNQRLKKKSGREDLNLIPKLPNSKIIVYGEKPILKNRTAHGPPLKNQKESISLPSYLKNITNQNYQNLCPNSLNEFYFVFWILFNKTLFIYISLHYLRKFISFLGTEYIRNLFKIFVTMKFIDGNILSIIKTFQDFNFQLNQQNVIDIKVNQQLKNVKRN